MRSSTDLRVKMLISESLKNGLMTSVKDGTTTQFWSDLQNIDALLLDDCQFLIDSTIDILLELSAIYRDAGKTLILAGDYLLNNVSTIPNLIVLHLVRPAQATRRIILQEKLQEKDLFLEDALLDLISGIEDPRRIAGFVAWLSATQDCS